MIIKVEGYNEWTVYNGLLLIRETKDYNKDDGSGINTDTDDDLNNNRNIYIYI